MGTTARQEEADRTTAPLAHHHDAAPVDAPAVPASPRVRQVLGLQRTVGNAAVGRLMGRAPRRPGGSRPAAARRDLARHEDALRSAVTSRQGSERVLARSPAYRPNPTWAQVGRNNPAPTCTPFTGAFGYSPEGDAKWTLYASVLPGQVTARCHCTLVGAAYARYLSATGGTQTVLDDGNCISEGLAAEDAAHLDIERPKLAAWAAVRDDIVRRSMPAGTTDVDLDLLEAITGSVVVVGSRAATTQQVNQIEYRENTKAGGLLFGGGHTPGEPADSECGDDTRVMTASVHLHRTDDGSNPARMEVTETITFRYKLHDGFDFCPGNTLQMEIHPLTEPAEVTQQRLEYNQLLTDLSRLEASGMARDVCFDVDYHRAQPASAHTIPVTPPAPVPTGPVLSTSGTVVADLLHVRGGPGTAFPIVGRAAHGRSLTFDCFSHGESVRGDDAWCRIAGTSTWVSHAYITDSGSGSLPACP
ncbi:MAG: hypothetical protein ACXVRW_10585 [Solirubrobacteraceae bacterium]